MKMKKLCALLLAGSMALSVAACGSDAGSGGNSEASGGGEESGSEASGGGSQASGSGSQAEEHTESSGPAGMSDEGNTDTSKGNYGGLVPLEDADDPITYTFFVRDPGTAPSDDNPVIKRIQELTGVTLKFEYLVGDLDQKLGVMVAGGDYPDVIFAGDAAVKLMDAGAFIPLEDEIPKYPNLNAMYKDVMKYLTYGDGHVYNMEIYGTHRNDVTKNGPAFECGIGFYIQKDVLVEAGYPRIRTLDEYFQVIEDYKEKHPEIDGVKTTGFEILGDGWRNWALINPVQNLLGAGNDGSIFVDPDTLETSFFQISDTSYEY